MSTSSALPCTTASIAGVEVRDVTKYQFPIAVDATRDITTIIDQDGNPWWVAKEVCEVLGLTNITEALRSLDDDEKSFISRTELGLKPGRDMVIINEPGIYNLIMRSRKPEAKSFKRWVTHDILPVIRKTGTYTAPQAAAAPSPQPDTQPFTININLSADACAQILTVLIEAMGQTESDNS
jgi:prophage antirepressor-like protein